MANATYPWSGAPVDQDIVKAAFDIKVGAHGKFEKDNLVSFMFIRGGVSFDAANHLRAAAVFYTANYQGAFGYMISMNQRMARGSGFTNAQLAGVLNCMLAEYKRVSPSMPAPSAQPALPQLNFDRVPACKILVNVPDSTGTVQVPLRVDRPKKGHWVDYVFVKDSHGPYGNKIATQDPGGNLLWGYGYRNSGNSLAPFAAATIKALEMLVADPMAVIAASGHLTNKCGICNRDLDDPISVQRGIGPICWKALQNRVYAQSTQPGPVTTQPVKIPPQAAQGNPQLPTPLRRTIYGMDFCASEWGSYACTREPGHAGFHSATEWHQTLAVWPDPANPGDKPCAHTWFADAGTEVMCTYQEGHPGAHKAEGRDGTGRMWEVRGEPPVQTADVIDGHPVYHDDDEAFPGPRTIRKPKARVLPPRYPGQE